MGFENRAVPLVPEKKPEMKKEKKTSMLPEDEWESMEDFMTWRSGLIDEETRATAFPGALEQAREIYHQEDIKVGKLDVGLFGVEHSRETLALFRKEIEEAVRDADIILTEAPVEASGDYDVLRTRAREKGTPLTLGRDAVFFLEIDRLAAKYGKVLLSVDPQYEADEKFQSGNTGADVMGNFNRTLDKYKSAGTVIGTVAAGGYAALEIGKTLQSIDEAQRSHQTIDLNLTRRNLLKGTVAGAGAYGIAKVGIENADVSAMRGEGPAGRGYIYDLHDYRDAVVAQALVSLDHAFEKPKKIVVFYGNAHKEGIKTYALNKNQLKTKLAFYKPFRDISPPTMSVYKFEKYAVPQKEQDTHVPVFGQWKKRSKTRLPNI